MKKDGAAAGASLVERLIAFEQDPTLLSFRFSHDALLFWPFIRFELFGAAVNKALSYQTSRERPSPFGLLEYAGRTALDGPFRRLRPFEIIIVDNTMSCTVRRDGRWFSRVSDPFAGLFPDSTLVLDMSYERRYRFPRHTPHVRTYDLLPLLAALCGSLCRPPAQDLAEIEKFVDHLQTSFPGDVPPGHWNLLHRKLENLSVRLPVLHGLFLRFLARTRPRIVFLEDASYGTRSFLHKWARDSGVRTAEFQHGLITRPHWAYNYNPALCMNAEFATYLPEFLLTYGEFWNTQVRSPSKTVVVGSPYLTEKASSGPLTSGGSSPPGRPGPLTVLVVSQATITNRMTALAKGLAEQSSGKPGIRIIFRLHPGEVRFRERYVELEQVPSVTIDGTSNIYDLIRSSDAVVGSSSTTLYEAVAFGKPVYVLRSADSLMNVPEDFGTWFDTPGELLSSLGRPATKGGPDLEHYWASGWEQRYKAFIGSL
jgi:hypothetical protein